jgi:phosphatidate cytidylyltransferase
MKFADLATRTVTAVVLISCILGAELISEQQGVLVFGIPVSYLFSFLALVFIALCSYEYVRLCAIPAENRLDGVLYAIVTAGPACALFLLHLFYPLSMLSQAASRIVALGVLSLFLSTCQIAAAGRISLEEAQRRTVELLIGNTLLGFGGASLLGFALLQTHELLFWVIAIVAANDIGAYFLGKLFGNSKLSRFISPGKSVEGALGGLLLGLIVGYLLTSMQIVVVPVPAMIAAVCIGIFGQCFDLMKSFIKRIAGVKDSGTLLPGHGGFLDRLDGILGGSLGLQALLILYAV